jgi:peptide/nickel transport system permease protein
MNSTTEVSRPARQAGFFRRLMRRRANVLALVYLAVWACLALIGQRLTGYEPKALGDLDNILSGPSLSHPLGTDAGGRDTLDQLIVGSQVDLRAAALATALGVAVGVTLGLAIGFARPAVDTVSMRLVEAIQAIPGVILITTIITVVGRGTNGATLAIGAITAVIILFATRNEVRRHRDELYVASATVIGVPRRKVAVSHVLPNVLPILVVIGAISFGGAILGLSGLSLLGFGQPPPTPSWGTMLQTATQDMDRQWFAVVPPGLTIASVVFAVNTLADGVRNVLGRSDVRPPKSSNSSVTSTLSIELPRRRDERAEPATPRSESASTRAIDHDTVFAIEHLDVVLSGPDGEPIPLVDDVSIRVQRGEVVGLVGESGSGKSLTVSAALGVAPAGLVASASSITLAGQDLLSLSRSVDRRRFVGTHAGMVFQNPVGSLNATQRVGAQVAATLRAHGGAAQEPANKRVLDLLTAVGVSDPERVARSFPHQLSGGLAQRVMIAAALAGDPDVVIADECTTALDVTVQAQVIDLLRSIADTARVGILFITHDLAVVTEIADRVAVMQHGKIVEEGTVAEIFTNPQHPYTRQLLQHVAAAGHVAPSGPAPVEDRELVQ